MKKLILLIGLILFSYSSCSSSLDECYATTYNIDVKAKDTDVKETYYVYEIHTVGNLCDTIKVRIELKPVETPLGNIVLNVEELNMKYYFVDRFRKLPDEILIY